MEADTKKQWEVIRSEQGPNLVLFQARYDWVRNPRNAKLMKAVILESADWVNIVALTPEKKVVIVRQFRFGVAKTTVEIPAGMMNKGETPEQAAVRELKEETGYTSNSWKHLGWFEANPAFLNNVCHTWLALDAVKTHSSQLDEGEEISIAELTLEEVRREIEQGNMRNSLTLLALSRVFDLRDPAVVVGQKAYNEASPTITGIMHATPRQAQECCATSTPQRACGASCKSLGILL